MVLRPAQLEEHKTATGLDAGGRARLSGAVSAVLAASAMRLTERAAARAESPKLRKHTRHWTATYPDDTRAGTKSLDADRAAHPDRWAQEMLDAIRPHLDAADTPLNRDAALAEARAAALGRAEMVAAAVRDGEARGEPIKQITERIRAGLASVPAWADRAAARIVRAAEVAEPAA
jgi:hypothetical protein